MKMTFAGRTVAISTFLASVPAFADGWIHCGPCNAGASADAAGLGSALLLVGLVAYGIRRKRS